MTLAANLTGGLVMDAMTVVALPDLGATAAEIGGRYASLGLSWRSLFLAVLGGMVITLLTRMQHASDDLGPKLVAGIAMSFVLVAAQLFHSVLDSIFMFTGLLGGQASYTWASCHHHDGRPRPRIGLGQLPQLRPQVPGALPGARLVDEVGLAYHAAPAWAARVPSSARSPSAWCCAGRAGSTSCSWKRMARMDQIPAR